MCFPSLQFLVITYSDVALRLDSLKAIFKSWPCVDSSQLDDFEQLCLILCNDLGPKLHGLCLKLCALDCTQGSHIKMFGTT